MRRSAAPSFRNPQRQITPSSQQHQHPAAVSTTTTADDLSQQQQQQPPSPSSTSGIGDGAGGSGLKRSPFKPPLSKFTPVQQQATPITATILTPPNTATTTSEVARPKKYFNVVWRLFTKKKHPNWAGDAILVVNGRTLTLIDMEGKSFGSNSSYPSNEVQNLKEGEQLQLSGKEIEIVGPLSAEDFESGKCFLVGTLKNGGGEASNESKTLLFSSRKGKSTLKKKEEALEEGNDSAKENKFGGGLQPVLKHGNIDSLKSPIAPKVMVRNLNDAYFLHRVGQRSINSTQSKGLNFCMNVS